MWLTKKRENNGMASDSSLVPLNVTPPNKPHREVARATVAPYLASDLTAHNSAPLAASVAV